MSAAKLDRPATSDPSSLCLSRSKQMSHIHRSLLVALVHRRLFAREGRDLRVNNGANVAQLSLPTPTSPRVRRRQRSLGSAYAPRSFKAPGHAPAREKEVPQGGPQTPSRRNVEGENTAAPPSSRIWGTGTEGRISRVP